MKDFFQELRTLRHKEPFAPFVIVLNDGRKLPVHRRLQFAFDPGKAVVLDERDRVTVFKLPQITDIQLLEPVAG